MGVQLVQPLGYSEPGGRSNNEDSLFPDPHTVQPDQKWFMVCDGVGGAERGEIASRLAVVSLDTFLQLHPVAVATPEYLQQAVAYAETQFNAYLTDNPQASGMATTLTLLYLHEAGATIAHIGDSRVYHVRNGQILWRTDDHSYVAELVKSGVLSAEEAQRHPQRNVITRALQGGTKPTQVSVHTITDIHPGDYFFLCSDGILERISDEILADTLGNSTANEQKMERLRAISAGNTRDNFTAYLVQLGTIGSHSPVPPPGITPIYQSFDHTNDDDTDEAITLINIPIPDAVMADQYPAKQTEPVPASMPVRTGAAPTSSAVNRPASRPVGQPVAPVARRSSGRWSVWLVALAGALIGAGGFLAWQQFGHLVKPAADEQTGAAESAIAASPPSNTPPAATPSGRQDVPHTTNQSATGTAENDPAAGLSMTPGTRPASGETDRPNRRTRYDIVRHVDNQLLVVRDPQTKRLGLQKSTGEPVTDLIYTGIGSFKNGIAQVDAAQGSATYLAKDGRSFSSFSTYREGVATLTDLDGKPHYLSQGGRWLDEVKSPSNGKIAVRKDDRWGYLNLQGQVSIFLQYDRAESFADDGTAEVSLNGKTFRINKKGDRVAETSDATTQEKPDKKTRNGSRQDT